MPDDENSTSEPSEIVYASPLKRVWAWVGVIYMVIITLLFTYFLAHAVFLNSIGPLMLIPGLGGLGATAIVRYRTGQRRGGLPACAALVALAALLIALNLYLGIPPLLAQLGG